MKTTQTRFDDKRSVAESVAETLLETLGRGGLRPALAESPRRRRRLGQIAGGVAMLAAAAVLGAAFLRPPEAILPQPAAVVELSRGAVSVLPAGAGREPSRPLTLHAGEAVRPGALIETRRAGGDAARAALRLAGGQSMRLDTGTRVRLASSSSLVLEQGAVYLDSAAGDAVEVRTTLGVVRDIGTRFEVRLMSDASGEPVLRVRVRDGRVVLEARGASHEAGAGVELALRGDGTLTRAAVPVHGPPWEWTLEAAPVPDLEGQRLAAFLDWLTREGGWSLQLAGAGTAEAVASTVLHGDARNLTPEQAAAMVLHGSGLGYRLVDGTFVVEPMAAAATTGP